MTSKTVIKCFQSFSRIIESDSTAMDSIPLQWNWFHCNGMLQILYILFLYFKKLDNPKSFLNITQRIMKFLIPLLFQSFHCFSIPCHPWFRFWNRGTAHHCFGCTKPSVVIPFETHFLKRSDFLFQLFIRDKRKSVSTENLPILKAPKRHL